MKTLRMKIRGSETLDHPQGTVVTRKQAERIAERDMPNDLRKAGFTSSVTEGARGWNLMYGKTLPSSKAGRSTTA